ncbi:MAG: 30S ribosomal protein S4e [Candidatus Hydrothermarchaeota archaeon]
MTRKEKTYCKEVVRLGRHLKRLAIPKHWPLPRKVGKWAPKPRAGPHSIERSLPLLVIVRDLLGYSDKSNEVKKIIHERNIMVDGRVCRDPKLPVGLMDVLEIKNTGEKFRVLIDKRGELFLNPIEENESHFKLCRVEDKRIIKGERHQLNLHDGRNHIVEDKNIKVGDVLSLKVPSQEIIDVLKFDVGALALIIGGSHRGKIGIINQINVLRRVQPNTVILTVNGTKIQTIKEFVFVVGKDEPVISLGR